MRQRQEDHEFKVILDYNTLSPHWCLKTSDCTGRTHTVSVFPYSSLWGVRADANSSPFKYDLIVGNPPYMKIAKDAPEALAMPDICYGAPNLYFLFATMGIQTAEKHKTSA